MKIGIITLPLTSNYGGILQNYALQQVLKRMGHEPITFDQNLYLWHKWLLECIKVIIKKVIGRKDKFPFSPKKRKQEQKPLRRFVEQYIKTTEYRMYRYNKTDIITKQLDAIIVGSDQVWRPGYNFDIEDKFFAFAEGMDIKRIAYAASFGTDCWEFSCKQTKRCAELVKQFDGVSVREKSGVDLCNEYLRVEATHVLDPTLLLHMDDYIVLCKDVPNREPFVFAYILDENQQKIRDIQEFAKRKGLQFFVKSAGLKLGDDDSIELWLSYFRDAAFVITDSFHGMAFSINFNKDFYVYENARRGNSRFDSLLGSLELKDRIIKDQIPNDGTYIEWQKVNTKREKAIGFSEEWLKNQIIGNDI